jgi:cell division protein FtsL
LGHNSILTSSNILKRFHIIIAGCIISITFWLLESYIDSEFDTIDGLELIPADLNELWMRSLIVILILAMSIYTHISQTRKLKIEREKSQLQQQLLDEQYSKMEFILDTRKQTQEALQNFNNSVLSIKKKIDAGEMLSETEVTRLSTIIAAVQNKLNRLWS